MTARNGSTADAPRPPAWVARACLLLQDNVPAGCAILDDHLRYVMVNPALAEINGAPVEAHLGRTIHEVIPRLADAIQRACRQVLDTGMPMVDLRLSMTDADTTDRTRHGLVSLYPASGPDGRVAGLAVVVREVTDAVRADLEAEAARRAQRRLTLLAETSAQLAEAAGESEQLTRLADLLINHGFADSCSVFMPDDAGRLIRRVVRIIHARLRSTERALVVERALAGTTLLDDDPRAEAWHTGKPTFTAVWTAPYLRDVDADIVAEATALTSDSSALTVPLSARGHRLGLFTVTREVNRSPFDVEDTGFLVDLGHRAGIAIDNLRLLAAQTRIADRLQHMLLPNVLPTIPGVELAARYLAAEQDAEVGGDFYDVFASDDGYALVIGDVAGRGIDAAGLTGTARASLRALADHLSPPAILARLNALLLERSGQICFLTLAFLLLRPRPQGAIVHTWLAGHPPPQVVHPDGAVTELGTPGHLLGVLPDVDHHQHTCELEHGDLLLLYTDGLTEARGPDGLFGHERLSAELARLAGVTATDAIDRLTNAVTSYRAGSSADDTAFLAVRLSSMPESMPPDQCQPDPCRSDRCQSDPCPPVGQGATGAWLGTRDRLPTCTVPVHHTIECALSALGTQAETARDIRLHLAATAQTVGATRHLLTSACHAWHLDHIAEPAALVFSELATNAVQHAGTDLDIRIAHQREHLYLAVRDRHPASPAPTDLARYHDVPLAQLPSRGRGLYLVETHATAWGCSPTADGKTVWATLRTG